MANRWVTVAIFLHSKITADGDCSHEIKRCLLLGRKVITNLNSILKNRDIALSTKVHQSRLCFSSSHVWMWEVLVTQSCLTLCDPVDYSPPGSFVHGILLARVLEWVAIPFSRGSSWPSNRSWVSCITGRFFTIWAIGKPPMHVRVGL